MRITLAGTAWTIKRLKRIVVDGEDCDGSCCRSSKTLEVRRDLEGVKELEILIHECRHALNDYLDEHYVDKESKDLAGVLWRLGYRKQPRRRG